MSGVNWTEKQLRAYIEGGEIPNFHKYKARKKEVDGIAFASTREAERYLELKAMEALGAIRGLSIQPKYVLQERAVIIDGKKRRVLRPITYIADFEYFESTPNKASVMVTEDVKGHKTEAYKIKAKMFRAKYPDVDFREIR